MLCKCLDCGLYFDYDERETWKESRGEWWGMPCSEAVSGCPECHGDYEELEPHTEEADVVKCKCCKYFCRDDDKCVCSRVGGIEDEIDEDDYCSRGALREE